jgi:hypothetical protein
LDCALEPDASELAQWLATLNGSELRVAAELRELPSLYAANCTSGFMERQLRSSI